MTIDAPFLQERNVATRLARLEATGTIPRVWRNDHTLWNPDPAEITDRLGWLTAPTSMRPEAADLQALGKDLQQAAYRHVVLLGMGGSSLGPEVLRSVLGSAEGYPQLIVLDSTLPSVVREVSEAISPQHTLFVVSSKSGSTIEPNCLYAHFRQTVEQACGLAAGQNFIAITDPGTVLERLASADGFRRTFLNPPDIGGRYSVLSYFGLLPAALMGLEIPKLLDRASAMAQLVWTTASHRALNPGARLGAAIAELALHGRDKLTLITSPSLASFGLWVEQLLAESTGKQGRGIVPIVGESPLTPEHYAGDRQFVYLRLDDDDNAETDAHAQAIAHSSHPLVRIDMRDRYDLAAEFYRWEFATAIAGAVLAIHPFDQPDVQSAKDMTDAMLAHLQQSGSLPNVQAHSFPRQLLSDAPPGSYVALLAYCQQTPALDAAMASLRQHISQQRRLATTAGYGPRYLHSTGQLHKGGPAAGRYLILTTDHDGDVPIPGRPYTFGQLARAQALGDLQALQSLGRPVAWVQLGSNMADDIRSLAASIG